MGPRTHDHSSVKSEPVQKVTRKFLGKFVVKWLLTTPSPLASFADINISQGNVATHARCGGSFGIHLTTNLPRNFPVNFLNRFRFDRIKVVSLRPTFSAHPVHVGLAGWRRLVALASSNARRRRRCKAL